MNISDIFDLGGIANHIIDYFMDLFLRSGLIGVTEAMIDMFSTLNQLNFDGISDEIQIEIFNAVKFISGSIINPVGCVLLGMFMMMEIIQLSTRYEGLHGISGFQIPMNAMFKFAFSFIFFARLSDVLYAIKIIFDGIQSKVNTISGDMINCDVLIEQVNLLSKDMDSGALIVSIILGVIVLCIIFFTKIIVSAIAIGRIFQIYIYMILSPIPMSTIPSSTQHNVAINFLKGFTAVCMQGLCISLIFYLFGIVIQNVTIISDSILKSYTYLAIYTVVLAMGVWGSGQLAKEIIGRV